MVTLLNYYLSLGNKKQDLTRENPLMIQVIRNWTAKSS